MIQATATTEFIGIACNRVTQAVAWGSDGLVAFAAYHSVALYYPQEKSRRGVFATLSGHTGRVNCVDFLNRGHELDQKNVAIVSGSVDKTSRVWKRTAVEEWVNSAVLEGHTGSVTTIGVVRARTIPIECGDLIATGSGDGTIRIWERSIMDDTSDKVKCIQVINLGTRYPMALAISYLPGTQVPVMACGGSDKKVAIYVQADGQFSAAFSLQGHDNWVRSVAFATYTAPLESPSSQHTNTGAPFLSNRQKLKDGDLLIASAAQDKYIRIWKISDVSEVVKDAKEDEKGDLTKDMLAALEESLIAGGDRVQLSTKAHVIDVKVPGNDEDDRKHRFIAMFEALLMGHDNWVYSVCWQPPVPARDSQGLHRYSQPMAIISASADKSMMIWTPDPETGIWVNQVRVGEIGGSTVGFFGGLFGPDGRHILAHSYNGAFHLWMNDIEVEGEQNWQPQITISGHYREVESLAWDPTKQFIISVSRDQTSRLFAPWRRENANKERTITWHEVGRPQIHGYDIQCIAFVGQWRYVSGSDEKILRVFDATKTIVESLAKITQSPIMIDQLESRPVGANLPALGLSNKAIFLGNDEGPETNSDGFIDCQRSSEPLTPTHILESPPFEEHLLQHTLWPEIDKLYGHGYELMCVGASHDGKLIASACKATTPEHAVVRLYSTENWKELPGPLQAHSLTITQVKFSHDDRYLLTVSRDRFWALFERVESLDRPYKFLTKNKAHARIIWDCSWSHDDRLFATASRDKTVRVWAQQENVWKSAVTLKFPEAVTAVDFAPRLANECHILAVGLENGLIHLCQSEQDDPERWGIALIFDKGICHVSTINRLSWRVPPTTDFPDGNTLQLASCGTDTSVRIFNVIIGLALSA